MVFIGFFVLALFLGTVIEYVVHRLMHHGWLFPKQHRRHHMTRGARGWFWEFGEFFLWALPAMCLGFLVSLEAGLGLLLGGMTYAVLAAYSHQLQHEHPERVFWLKYPIHYLHHRYDKGRYNYGVLLDVWDRVLGTYKVYDHWRPPADYCFSLRQLFEIKWF